MLVEERLHFAGELLHAAVACEKNEGAAIRLRHIARDPLRKRSVVTRVARVRHFLHDEKLHLLLEIERAAELHRLGCIGADAPAEISQILLSDGERCTR